MQTQDNKILVVFDTETTGVSKKDGVLELAAFIHSDTTTLKVVEMADPGVPINPRASEVHGYYQKDVQGKRPIQDVFDNFVGCLNTFSQLGELVLCAHNIKFDLRMLKQYGELPPHSTLCTLAEARKHYPDAPNHKLTTLVNYLGIEGDFNAHTAMDDVLMCYELLKVIEKDKGVDWRQAA